MATRAASVAKVAAATALRSSEPDPRMFGNGPNEASNPNWSNKNWLKSIFHFSFAEVHYPEPNRNRCGVLRVMNDDLVQPSRGFGTHGHGDMEICTYIVKGDLTHQDSMGTAETLSRGAVQFMTAGTGVRHSEFNNNKTDPLRFIQMWIVPRKRGLKPNYGSASIPAAERDGKWSWMVGDVDDASSVNVPVRINQDCNMYAQEITEGSAAAFEIKEGRQAYILTVESGETQIAFKGGAEGSVSTTQHDALEVVGPVSLEFAATAGPSHMLIVEMAA